MQSECTLGQPPSTICLPFVPFVRLFIFSSRLSLHRFRIRAGVEAHRRQQLLGLHVATIRRLLSDVVDHAHAIVETFAARREHLTKVQLVSIVAGAAGAVSWRLHRAPRRRLVARTGVARGFGGRPRLLRTPSSGSATRFPSTLRPLRPRSMGCAHPTSPWSSNSRKKGRCSRWKLGRRAGRCTSCSWCVATRKERVGRRGRTHGKKRCGCCCWTDAYFERKKRRRRPKTNHARSVVDRGRRRRYATMAPNSAATSMQIGTMECHLASSIGCSSCASEGASASVSIGCSSFASSMGSSFASGSSTLGGVGFGWLRIGTQRRSSMSLFL